MLKYSRRQKVMPPGGWRVPIRYLRQRQANEGPSTSVQTLTLSAVHVTYARAAAQVHHYDNTAAQHHRRTHVTIQRNPIATSPDTAVWQWAVVYLGHMYLHVTAKARVTTREREWHHSAEGVYCSPTNTTRIRELRIPNSLPSAQCRRLLTVPNGATRHAHGHFGACARPAGDCERTQPTLAA